MDKKISMQDLKKCAGEIADFYGLSYSEGIKLVAYYNAGKHKDLETVAAMIGGDWSMVSDAASALGISLHGVNTSERVQDSQNGGSKKNARKAATKEEKKQASSTDETISEKMRRIGALGIESKKRKLQELEKSRQAVPTVSGEIVQGYHVGELPENVTGLVMDVITSYCEQNNITDLSKERQPRWGAACYMVGVSVFKKSKILHDIQREKTTGGIVYDVGRVSALADLWGVLCQNFCKAPLIDDFARFAGLSDTWIYGANMPDGLTPARSALLQKLKRMQEAGLSSMIVDGRQNPTGALAALNHWHGWTQTREIIHSSGAAAVSAPSLPVFDGSAGLLMDNSAQNVDN